MGPSTGIRAVLPDAFQLTSSHSATADLYMGWSCRDWIESGSVERLSPTVFHAGQTIVVFRHTSGMRLPSSGFRIIVVVDDDVSTAVRDMDVPAKYRAKLALVEARTEKRLLAIADRILVASDNLAGKVRAAFPETPVERIDPAWPSPPPLDVQDRETVSMAFLTGQSHAGDFRSFLPVLDQVLWAHCNLRFVVSANLPLPRWVRDHSRVSVIPAMNWKDYRDWMSKKRYNIGVYPISATGMNAARSSNKLSEYAQYGAAVVASETWDAGRMAARDGRCVVVAEDHDAWVETLGQLIEDRGLTARIAQTNRAALCCENGMQIQRDKWAELLSISSDMSLHAAQ